MNVQQQFSKYADHYGQYNIIQKKVARKLIDDLGTQQPMRIVDLGCGSGTLYESLTWEPEHFIGIDFAKGMLAQHPKAEHIECRFGDFNDSALFEALKDEAFEHLFSASALQWSENIEKSFQNIASLNRPFSLAIFTSKTFETLHKTAGLKPLLESSQSVREKALKCFTCKSEVVEYRLSFESTRDIFNYIKKSGVSGARNVLSYKETKALLASYPVDYLEFEVLFLSS